MTDINERTKSLHGLALRMRGTGWFSYSNEIVEAAATLEAQAAYIAKLEATLKFYSNPFESSDDITIPDFYDEMDFGQYAAAALQAKP